MPRWDKNVLSADNDMGGKPDRLYRVESVMRQNRIALAMKTRNGLWMWIRENPPPIQFHQISLFIKPMGEDPGHSGLKELFARVFG